MPDYSQPHEVTDDQINYPDQLGDLLPPHSQEIKDWALTKDANQYLDFITTWEEQGLGSGSQMFLKPGINGTNVLRHLKAVMGSFQPTPEHKIDSASWLLAQWCDKVVPDPYREKV